MTIFNHKKKRKSIYIYPSSATRPPSFQSSDSLLQPSVFEFQLELLNYFFLERVHNLSEQGLFKNKIKQKKM